MSAHPSLKARVIVGLGILASLGASAGAGSPRFTEATPPTQRVFVENTNLSAEDFFTAYMSQAVEERRYSELYLLGVLDATEGTAWCDYRKFKTTTLGEEIFAGLKGLEPSRRKVRAARVIVDILSSKFPCRSK